MSRHMISRNSSATLVLDERGVMSTTEVGDLGEFLRSRRAQTDPVTVGLPSGHGRRVPGLRREEVAQLAGVSLDYYARLEQGRQRTASPAVLDGIARALRLTDEEHAYVFTLAGVRSGERGAGARPRAVGRSVQRVVGLMDDTPVIVCGAFVDIVDANEPATFLFADFNAMPAHERNGLRWMLLSPVARERYGLGWDEAAREMIGITRMNAGNNPNDPHLAELVSELSARSSLFREVWGNQAVAACTYEKELCHPSFGRMIFFHEYLNARSAPDQTMITIIPSDPPSFEGALKRWRRT